MEKEDIEKRFVNEISNNEMLLHKVCRIYAYTFADRQDLFQEIVIQLWKAYPRFKGDAKISTWMYRIAINTAITGFRKKKDFIAFIDPVALPGDVSDHPSEPEEEERFRQLYKAIEELNEIEKAIVMLYLEDQSYLQMEEILGISEGNLRVKMSRIKDKLRKMTKVN